MIDHPQAAWGVTEGNPIWEEMREVALRTDPTFLVNVTLNADRRITGVFAGDMLAAHAAGCNFVKQHAMVAVAAPFDIVVGSNSGYPLDQNLYQAVKGMSAAARIVRPGGAIIIAAACADGLPDHGRYAALLAEGGSPQGVLAMVARPGFNEPDQWQVQIQARVQLMAKVYVRSGGLTDEQIRRAAASLPRHRSNHRRDRSRAWPAGHDRRAARRAANGGLRPSAARRGQRGSAGLV